MYSVALNKLKRGAKNGNCEDINGIFAAHIHVKLTNVRQT